MTIYMLNSQSACVIKYGIKSYISQHKHFPFES
uniref:Uncharacterized protein n=1 Tax=Musa acuminata subsp. malaccensis TaxID=214687 RepID=A0A804KGC4_MUSAM